MHLKNLELFLKGAFFFRGVVLSVAVISPLFIMNYLGLFAYAPSVVVGAFLNAPGDIPGSLKRKLNGILIGILLTMLVTLIILFAKPYLLLLIISVAILTFSISLIAVYGFRASLISFSGLLAMVIAFALPMETPKDIWIHIGLMGVGGLWYLFISYLLHRLIPKKDEDQLLSDTLQLIGDYLKLRSRLLLEKDQRDNLLKQTFSLQTKINEKHETLRESLLLERKRSGKSHYDEKRLLIFIASVDMLELAVANHLEYSQIDSLFSKNQESLKAFGNFNVTMGNHLNAVSELLIKKDKIPADDVLLEAQSTAHAAIRAYVDSLQLPQAREGALILRNLYDYQSQLLQNIQSIKRAMENVKDASKVSLKRQDASQFLTLQEYNLNTIFEHFTLESTIFRHALRITFAIIFGFILGKVLNINNTYWIMLTIIVILRPNYGLTKERSKKRVIGTLIGGTVAVGIIFLTQNTTVYAVLSIISLTLAFSLIQQNYTSAAAFVTTNVIFVYALLHPNAFAIIQYRVVDTLIGAAIAFAASYMLWPTWEVLNLKDVMVEAIEKNKTYLNKTQALYHNKSTNELCYKVSRKEAFLAISNLNAAFQRMTQDPKSKQIGYEIIYDMVTLNQTILSAIASIGSFIILHKTTPASDEFDALIRKIENTLEISTSLIMKKPFDILEDRECIRKTQEKLLESYSNLSSIRDQNIKAGQTTIDKKTLTRLQEAHLISNQLIWLQTLSDNLKKASTKYQSVF
ncbi:MAG: FUSC family membrane protein [Aquaticitalea sp.]